MVMYAGRAAEKAPKQDIFYQPHHPYTKGLLESIPNSSAAGDRLQADPRAAAQPDQPPGRLQVPPPVRLRDGPVPDRGARRCTRSATTAAHVSACWLPRRGRPGRREAEELRAETVSSGHEPGPRRGGRGDRAAPAPKAARPMTGPAATTRASSPAGTAPDADDDVLVRVENLVKYFPVKAAGFAPAHGRAGPGGRRRVAGRFERGKTLGLVGETGLRQVHAGPLRGRADPGDLGQGHLRRARHHQPVPRARCGRSAARSR